MKVLAIQTSPNVDGLTASLAIAALVGAESAGAETELVHLRQLDLETCRACDRGWGSCRTENRCVIEDDFQELRDALGDATAVIVSTPVYFGEVSEVAKTFFDRLRRCEWGRGEESPIHGTPAIGIAAAGGSGNGAATALVMLERYLQMVGLRPFDLVTVTRFNREYKLSLVEVAGRKLAESAKGA